MKFKNCAKLFLACCLIASAQVTYAQKNGKNLIKAGVLQNSFHNGSVFQMGDCGFQVSAERHLGKYFAVCANAQYAHFMPNGRYSNAKVVLQPQPDAYWNYEFECRVYPAGNHKGLYAGASLPIGLTLGVQWPIWGKLTLQIGASAGKWSHLSDPWSNTIYSRYALNSLLAYQF